MSSGLMNAADANEMDKRQASHCSNIEGETIAPSLFPPPLHSLLILFSFWFLLLQTTPVPNIFLWVKGNVYKE